MNLLKNALLLGSLMPAALAYSPDSQAASEPPKPTVILVHGAFAESSSWAAVVRDLSARGYDVVAAANPLRSVANDAKVVDSLVAQAAGPVILVGHSYGGAVISNTQPNPKVKGLVFVAAFAPDKGETALKLSSLFPGGTLGDALAPPVKREDGTEDLYIRQDRFAAQFAADVPAQEALVMAATQRPIALNALQEAGHEPRWRTTPSWFVYGDADKNIPAKALQFMADRAGSKQTVVVAGASHVVMVSHPRQVAELIVTAAGDALKDQKSAIGASR